VASFLLESYSPKREAAALDELTARARKGAADAAHEGLEVRHVRSFIAPDDDMCFHIFEAPSANAVARVSELASLDHERITEVIE
jgi:hypothetical protein